MSISGSRYDELVPRAEQSRIYWDHDDDDIPSSFIVDNKHEANIPLQGQQHVTGSPNRVHTNADKNELVGLINALRDEAAANAKWSKEKMGAIERDLAQHKKWQSEVETKLENLRSSNPTHEWQDHFHNLEEKMDVQTTTIEREMLEFKEKNETRWEEVEAKIVLVLNEAVNKTCKILDISADTKSTDSSSHHSRSPSSSPASPPLASPSSPTRKPPSSHLSHHHILPPTSPTNKLATPHPSHPHLSSSPNKSQSPHPQPLHSLPPTSLVPQLFTPSLPSPLLTTSQPNSPVSDSLDSPKPSVPGSSTTVPMTFFEGAEVNTKYGAFIPSTPSSQSSPDSQEQQQQEQQQQELQHSNGSENEVEGVFKKRNVRRKIDFGDQHSITAANISNNSSPPPTHSTHSNSTNINDALATRNITSLYFDTSHDDVPFTTQAADYKLAQDKDNSTTANSDNKTRSPDFTSKNTKKGNTENNINTKSNMKYASEENQQTEQNGGREKSRGDREQQGSDISEDFAEPQEELGLSGICHKITEITNQIDKLKEQVESEEGRQGGAVQAEDEQTELADQDVSEQCKANHADDTTDRTRKRTNERASNSGREHQLSEQYDQQTTKQPREQHHQQPTTQTDNQTVPKSDGKLGEHHKEHYSPKQSEKQLQNQPKFDYLTKQQPARQSTEQLESQHKKQNDVQHATHAQKEVEEKQPDRKTSGEAQEEPQTEKPEQPETHGVQEPDKKGKEEQLDKHEQQQQTKLDNSEKHEQKKRKHRREQEHNKPPDNIATNDQTHAENLQLKTPIAGHKIQEKASNVQPPVTKPSDRRVMKWQRLRKQLEQKRFPSNDSIRSKHSVNSDLPLGKLEMIGTKEVVTPAVEKRDVAEGVETEKGVHEEADKAKSAEERLQSDKEEQKETNEDREKKGIALAAAYNLQDFCISVMPLIPRSQRPRGASVTNLVQVVIALSGFDPKGEDYQDLKAKVERLGGRCVDDLNDDVSHLVVPSDHKSAKRVYAIVRRIWIMTPEWITKSSEKGWWMEERGCAGQQAPKCILNQKWLSISKSYAEDEPDRASHARELMRLGNGGVTRSKTLADLILVVDHVDKGQRQITWFEFVNLIMASLQDIINNSRRASRIVSPLSGRYLELDLWIPDLKLSFEFQDPHHYTSTYYAHSNVLGTTQLKDGNEGHTTVNNSQQKSTGDLKKDKVEEKGETLIKIPCWWDGSIDRLVATIRGFRHELLPGYPPASPIPFSPPHGFFKEGILPDVGELMTASLSPVQFSPKYWWIVEKYEGMRVCWNGEDKRMYLYYGKEQKRKFLNDERYGRTGRECVLLPTFYHSFPADMILECEIWLGRGQENTTSGFASHLTKTKRHILHESTLWELFRMVALDSPHPPSLAYESRFATTLELPSSHPFIIIAMCSLCKGRLHAKNVITSILNDGGGGVYFWNSGSTYKSGRTDDVIQLNTRKGQEGLVVGDDDNGCYIVKLPNREETVVALPPDYDFPDLGDVVTLSYPHYSHEGVPEYPKIEAVLKHLAWADILLGFRTPKTHLLGNKELKQEDVKQHRKNGYWTDGDQQNVVRFFDEFARARKGNPHDPNFWYKVKRSEIKDSKGAGILGHYNGSLVNALMDVYPSIGLNPEEFPIVTRNYWRSDGNRRKFFDNYAKKNKFDPLLPENWYTITREAMEEEGAATVLSYYPGSSVAKALLDLYPDIGLQFNKFSTHTRWTSASRRAFFDKFAKKSNFDPLVASNWYSVTRDSVLEEEGGTSILHHHFGGSVVRALMTLYPDIGLVASSFSTTSNKVWHPITKRKFFDTLAKKYNFDPLTVENWRDMTKDIVAQHGGKTLLDFCHGGSLTRALSNVYPQLKFTKPRMHPHYQTTNNQTTNNK